jgi:PAS domain S-box-containing protein
MKYFRWIRNPPTYEGNAEKTRHAEILHYASILLFVFSLILFWFNLLFGSEAEKSANWILGLIAAMQILIQWMIRSGYVNQASFTLLTIGWAAMTEISRNVSGVRDVAILCYVLILLGSGYLLGWRIATVYTLTSIAAIWWLAYVEAKGVIVPATGYPYRIALDLTVIFILIFLVIYFLTKTLTNSLESAQRELAERRRVEQALEVEQERLHLALDAAHMGTWNWDIETGAVSWSVDILRLFSIELEQVEGQFDSQYEMYLSLIHPDDLPRIQENFQRALSGEITDFVVVYRSILPSGEIRWLESRGKVYRADGMKPIRMAGTIVNVTERKQADTERERLIQALEAKNKELEQFTYTVSHDLKVPLITINGFLGYLEEDMTAGDLDRVNHDSQRIQEAVGKMRLLLDQLLELSRIGRMMNPPEEISFEELAREALDNVHGGLEEHSIAVRLSPNLPAVYGDRQRLIQVLQNLIDNAAKFMGEQPRPEIEIGQQGQENGMPIFFVKDNGIGIAPEHHELIFALFQRLDPKTDGTGIGLALVKRIIDFHGGRIWVESEGEAGKGSTFYFTLESKRNTQ